MICHTVTNTAFQNINLLPASKNEMSINVKITAYITATHYQCFYFQIFEREILVDTQNDILNNVKGTGLFYL